jgi:rare lipoprotein A
MRTVIGMALLAALQACVPVRWEEPQPTVAPATRSKPESATRRRSGRGNPTFYEVYGVRYHVLDSSDGYQERGVASWYGKKFHGRPTSSGEIYDM